MTYAHRRKSLMPLWLSEFSNLHYHVTELEEKDNLGYISFWKMTTAAALLPSSGQQILSPKY